MKRTPGKTSYLIFALLCLTSQNSFSQHDKRLVRLADRRLDNWTNPVAEWTLPLSFSPDSVIFSDKVINIFFPVSLSYQPIREKSNTELVKSLSKSLGRRFKKFDIRVFTNGFNTTQLIPNIFRESMAVDMTRIPPISAVKPRLITRTDALQPSKGLANEYIALWNSHGYYFEQSLDRWEWQRAKLFGTVEDLYTMTYVQPFLTPMLEKAGATVFIPRERDIQINEVIVDNDRSSGHSEFKLQSDGIEKLTDTGFLLTDTLFSNMNPFRLGSSISITKGSSVYIPEIPESGEYAVYVSYKRASANSKTVNYTIHHTGGNTSFIVDQTIGGSTWIYLGTFLFKTGLNAASGSVEAIASDDGLLSLDAVKFGGGMGNVARRPSAGFSSGQWASDNNLTDSCSTTLRDEKPYSWKISGKPRYMEGSRYFLQYAGMPDSVVYSQNFYKNDYNDDYQSRGNWVNYLIGNTGANEDRSFSEGLGLPVDLAFAFHTDAGITPDTTVIGTLGIYSTENGGGWYSDSVSRLAGRDLADIIQNQIVDDISGIYNIMWPRRGLWDRPYSEARKPDVPVMLLELLSHQNMADQQYGLDPRFRFNVCRAIYKGMLKFLAYNENRDYIVQPLPVTHLAIARINNNNIRLSWQPSYDSLEPTAKPDCFRIYKRTGDNGFDNGVVVTNIWLDIKTDEFNTVYSFKVTALNEGGESFDSEVLSAGFTESDTTAVVVVNGFDRICGPAWFDKDGMAGVAWWDDRGVAWHYDFASLGDQYDFDRKSPWIDDDNSGWGATYCNNEGKVVPGNTFDYPYIHGRALLNAGRSFISVSDEAFCESGYDVEKINDFDILFGEEKSTPSVASSGKTEFAIYSPEFINKLSLLINSGKNIFLSGAYLGSELINTKDTLALMFASDYLRFKPRTGHAVKTGSVYSTDYSFPYFKDSLNFNTENDVKVYGVEAPDAIEPAGDHSVTAFRYSENNTSAGVMYMGKSSVLILGFPFETITSEKDRNELMKQIMDFFDRQ